MTVKSPVLGNVDVVVLAGGLGTRIRPILGDVPKLLAPINDRTYLDYLCEWLAGFGATRLVLSLGHLADRVVSYVEQNSCPGLTIDTVIEETPRGTAGALRLVRPQVRSSTALVMNGDSWIGADLGKFVESHNKHKVAATLMCVRVDESGRYGRVDVDEHGFISAFREKQADDGPGLINAGVYAFSKAGWDLIDACDGPSLERDVFSTQAVSTLAAYDAGAVPFIDIGTPESLQAAARIIGRRDDVEGDT